MFFLTILERLNFQRLNFSQGSVKALFLTTRQKAKIRNAFANNISTDIKLNKAQISKEIQSGGFLGSWLGKMINKDVVTDLAISFAKNNLFGLVSNVASNCKVVKRFRGIS